MVFLSQANNINDFGRFADGGSDSNWYIGFNNAWIIKLPPSPPGEYSKAFIGAKIGRAKSQSVSDSPWERVKIPGKIYMAISQTPSFGSEQSFFLADAADIPAEPNPNANIPGTGHSEWFWTEVQTTKVSPDRPNYLIIWSPSRDLRDAAHSPILAGIEASSNNMSEPVAWNNHSIQGVPPRSENGALQVPIMNIRPALAIKLVSGNGRAVRVDDLSTEAAEDDLLIRFSVEGRDVELAWVEISQDELEWRRASFYLRHPPYIVTLPRSLIPARGIYVRAKARDIAAVEGRSGIRFIQGTSGSNGKP
ncbi:MAG: hypothetical protein HY922_04120 [Elusimicrobia bacterium]|nr:hypothetical protein [Elusimicrobiota bacterium]